MYTNVVDIVDIYTARYITLIVTYLVRDEYSVVAITSVTTRTS